MCSLPKNQIILDPRVSCVMGNARLLIQEFMYAGKQFCKINPPFLLQTRKHQSASILRTTENSQSASFNFLLFYDFIMHAPTCLSHCWSDLMLVNNTLISKQTVTQQLHQVKSCL